MGDLRYVPESTLQISFEVLIDNVRDAIILEEDFYSTVEQILEGLRSGRLNRDDYEITRHVIHEGIYWPPKYNGPVLGSF